MFNRPGHKNNNRAMPLIDQHGIFVTAERLAELTGAHRTTVERWKRTQRLPRAVQTLIELVEYGDLERLHPVWRGWHLDRRTGALYTPAGDGPITPGNVLAIPLRMQQVRALELELASIVTRHARTREQARLLGALLKRSQVAL